MQRQSTNIWQGSDTQTLLGTAKHSENPPETTFKNEQYAWIGICQKKTNIKVDNRCLKKCFTPLTFSNKRCHLTPISIAIIKKIKNKTCQ